MKKWREALFFKALIEGKVLCCVPVFNFGRYLFALGYVEDKWVSEEYAGFIAYMERRSLTAKDWEDLM